MYITGKYFLGNQSDGCSEFTKIRNAVFCEELSFPVEFSYDSDDALSIHAVAYLSGDDFKNPVSSGRLEFVDDYFKISKVCTLPEFRNKGYGDFVVRMLIDKAVTMGADEIFCDVLPAAVPFFRKIGFSEIGASVCINGIGELVSLSVKPCNCTHACHCS